jgi:hypothetical protein
MNIDKKVIYYLGAVLAVILLLLGILGHKSSTEIKVQNEVVKELEKALDIEENLCEKFSEKFISETIEMPVIKKEFSKTGSSSKCDYYISQEGFLTVQYETDKDVENQRKSLKLMNETIASDAAIPIDHFLVMKNDQSIQGVYLVMGTKSFISITQNSYSGINKERLISLSEKIAQMIKVLPPVSSIPKVGE